MHTPNNQNSNARTSAAQIVEEELSKGELIRNGFTKQLQTEYPNADHDSVTNMAYGKLSAICGMLTGTNKDARQWAKAEVRRLVKLGKGE